MLLGGEGGIYEIEPDHIRPQPANRPGDGRGRSQAIRVPTPNDVKAIQFLLVLLTERLSIFVSSPFITGELVAQYREID